MLEQAGGGALAFAAAGAGGDPGDLLFVDPVVLPGFADTAPGVAILDVGGNSFVVDQVGVPHHIFSVIGQADHGQIVAAPGPVAHILQGDYHLTVSQGVVDLLPAVGALLQIEAHFGGGVVKHYDLRAPLAAVVAVPGGQFHGSQLLVGKIGGNHGKGGDAAAVGFQQIIAVGGIGVVLLDVQLHIGVAFMGNIGVEKIRFRHAAALEGEQGNGGIVHGHGVFRHGIGDDLPGKLPD